MPARSGENRNGLSASGRETPRLSESPQELVENMLAAHVAKQCADAKIAIRAKIMAVSVPTYQKRLQGILESEDHSN